MMTMENIAIFIAVVAVLWYVGIPLMQFLTLLYFKFRTPEVSRFNRDEVPSDILEQISAYEQVLFGKGFVRGSVLMHDGPMVGSSHRYYIFYYHQPQTGVHAFLETQPYAGALQPVRVMFESIYEDGRIVVTENGMKHFLLATPKEVSMYDHYLPHWEDVYQKHLDDQEEVEGVLSYSMFDDEGAEAYLNYLNQAYTEAYIANGIASKTTYGLRVRASVPAWKVSQQMVQGQKRFKKVLKTATSSKDVLSDKSSRIQAIVTQMENIGKKRGESNPMLWFSGSVIAFVLLYGLLGFDLLDIAMLLLVLFIHELGHFFAMRYFGYSDTSIFFLPFGAVTLGKKEQRSAWEEYVVSLAGPLPGILIAIAIIGWQFWYLGTLNGSMTIHFFALMSIVINYINLLPIYPLDGGRIVQTLFLLRYPRVQFYFYLGSIALLVAAVFYWQDWLLLFFVFILAIGFHQNRAISRVLKRIDRSHISKEEIAKAVLADEKYGRATLDFQARVANHVYHILQTGKPGKVLVILGGLFYFALLLPPVAIAVSTYTTFTQSEYGKLSKEEKAEVRAYYRTLGSFEGLIDEGMPNLDMQDAMHRLDRFFKEQNLSQPLPAQSVTAPSGVPCEFSRELVTLYKWHDGVISLLGDEDIFSLEQMQRYYAETVTTYPDLDKSWIPLTTDRYERSLAMLCGKNGLYRYNGEGTPFKVYYSVAHMLHLYADLFDMKRYTKGESGDFYIKPSVLSKVERRYLLPKDKARYEKKIAFLKQKAQEYHDSSSDYMRRMVIWSMKRMNDAKLIDALALYVHDKNEEIAKIARDVIKAIEDENDDVNSE